MIDADLAIPVTEYESLATYLTPATPVVIGSRYLPGSRVVQPLLRRIAGKTFSWLARMMLGLRYRDTQCGFKLFTREAAQLLFRKACIDGFAFDVEILYIAQLRGIRVAEIPIHCAQGRASTLHIVSESVRMARDLFRIRSRRAAYIHDQGRLAQRHPWP